jgi:hypothetical protein
MAEFDGLFARLLDLNREAYAGRDYTTAYHLLVAALHRAIALASPAALEVVAARAAEQRAGLARPERGHGLTRVGLRHRREEYAALADLAAACADFERRIPPPSAL